MSLNGVAYPANVLNAHAVPYFDNHPLADKLIFMDDKKYRVALHFGRSVYIQESFRYDFC